MGEGSFLKRLQSADEATKRRWIVALTAAATVIVVYVWLAYFSNLLTGASYRESSGADARERFTFWQAVRNGGAIVYENLADAMGRLGGVLQAPREYIIQPPK